MKYDFSTSTPREETNAEKYVLREKLFGTNDVLPAWVADMDIDTPPFVIEAVKKRLEHPIIGYEEVPPSMFEAQIEWMRGEHGVEFALEDMLYSHSVVASMNAVIEAFSDKGDKVIVQTPVYPPFFHSVIEHERELLKNPLKQKDDGSYTFDIDDLKSKIDKRTKLLLLSSPHNPVGRVWRREELEMILEVCLEHNIVVFSDEIHCDLVYDPLTGRTGLKADYVAPWALITLYNRGSQPFWQWKLYYVFPMTGIPEVPLDYNSEDVFKVTGFTLACDFWDETIV